MMFLQVMVLEMKSHQLLHALYKLVCEFERVSALFNIYLLVAHDKTVGCCPKQYAKELLGEASLVKQETLVGLYERQMQQHVFFSTRWFQKFPNGFGVVSFIA